MVTNTLTWYRTARADVWQWRNELSLVKKILLTLGMAAAVGLLAQIKIPLPGTPVPVTGQTFGILLAAVLLGKWWGGASIAIYAILGALGVPWFNSWTGGISHIAGPTGGYIIGFIFAALALGFLTDKYLKARSFFGLLGLMFVTNYVFVYGFGLLQLNLWLNMVQGTSVSLSQLLTMGLVPFIPGEVIKVPAAALAAWALTPKKDARENRT